MEDEKLVKAAIKGDDEAFYQIINEHKDRLYRIAYSYLSNKHDALEAVQETTYRAYVNIHKLKQPQYVSTWVIRILINYCTDEYKRKGKTTVLHDNIEDYKDNADNTEKIDVETALEKLNPKYREVILLKYFEDLTITEISKVLDCPEGTVKTWLSRGLKSLRAYLKKGGVYDV